MLIIKEIKNVELAKGIKLIHKEADFLNDILCLANASFMILYYTELLYIIVRHRNTGFYRI